MAGLCFKVIMQVSYCAPISVSEVICFISEFLSGRLRRELIAALRQFKENLWSYLLVRALLVDSTERTPVKNYFNFVLFPCAVSKAKINGNSELYIKSGSDINLTCIVLQTPEPPSFIYWWVRAFSLDDSAIEFVPRIFRHDRVLQNPNLQWPPFDGICFNEKISTRMPGKTNLR